MTRGERTRNPRAIQRETELRRGGPAQAQQTLRDFDNDRASAFSDRLVRVATRGRNPNTESLSDAGTVVADDLRSGYEAMQTQQSARYAEAMRLAEAQRVAPTDELAANVNRVVEENFLDVGPAVGVINRLQAQINAGSANYGSIERARQQLNRLLGASMRAGDDAQTYAIHRVIDELDAFAEPRLTGEAQTAIREARRYTREMMGTYGEQARPDLATGHVGRGDRGGRRIRDIIENDMTGEQVIDAIFGAGGRPPAPALAAVRRIHDRATRTISTGGYEAPSGAPGQQQRAPGRESLRGGRSTTGGRQFLEPTEAQRAQLGLGAGEREAIADPSLQALREAFIYRLSRRLTNRQQGDGIPARLMASDLRAALDGTGSEITPLLFNAEERSMLRRAMLAMEQVSPPSGQYNPSAPGIAQDAAERSFAAIAARILGEVPYVGPSIGAAIQDGIVNARAIRDAREAVARSAAAPVAPTWRSDLFQSRPQPAAPASSAAQSDVDRRARR
jgi:hypothetical protein